MNYPARLDVNHLRIFHESKRRRLFVGELKYDVDRDIYELIYDKNYTESRTAIPLGPHLTLFELRHQSEKGKMFPIFLDRIPDRENPAYVDYCASQGISPDETNPIVLLGSIGRRGPSSFIFEPVYHTDFNTDDIQKLREKLGITQHDIAEAFDLNIRTLQRIEKGTSHDVNTIKLLQILLGFPEVARWQLRQTGGRLHKNVLAKLRQYFQNKPQKR